MSDEIFKISKNSVRAKSLIEMAKERLEDVHKESKVYRIIEGYYEVIKELITAIMYAQGFKTLSHKMLIEYLQNNFKEFDKSEIILMDELRKLRNNIVYYGQRVEKAFLINQEREIKDVIEKLVRIANASIS